MNRRDIHYWKCDRSAAFYGTRTRVSPMAEIEQQLRDALQQHFRPSSRMLSPGCGQGNHLTWNVEVDGKPLFIRIENGPAKDDYLEMESAVLMAVGDIGVPVPEVHGWDVSRTPVPFAWQALERLNHRDLNHWYRQGVLDSDQVSFEIGRNVASWQSIAPDGFGPFNLDAYRSTGELRGLHGNYASWFILRLDQHLHVPYRVEFSISKSAQTHRTHDSRTGESAAT